MKKFIFIIFFSFISSGAYSAPPFSDHEARIADLEAQVDMLLEMLDGVTRGADPVTGLDTLQFSGMNVQIVNGTDYTYKTNYLGNLIIGYNESRGDDDCPDGIYCDRRNGSHNLILGEQNNYTKYGGLVAGHINEVTGAHSTVSGGTFNLASGDFSSVCGGLVNTASGFYSTVSGGNRNNASGGYSSVSGGEWNTASAYFSSVSGGKSRHASGDHDWVAGTLWQNE